MTVFYYILIAMISALSFAGAALVVFKAGEKDLICKYGQEDEKPRTGAKS